LPGRSAAGRGRGDPEGDPWNLLAERSADADDRRAKHVSLRRSGRALMTRIFDRHRAVLDAAADGLTGAERETLIALLKKLGLSAQAKLAEESAG